MGMMDRILTIVVTATLTSFVWIVAGGSLIENATADSQRGSTRPAEAAPSPSDRETAAGFAMQAVPKPNDDRLHDTTSTEPVNAATNDLVVPVLNVRPRDLTDTFTDGRDDGERLHEAIDIMAPTGTTVISAAPGTLERIFESKAGGKTLYVRSKDSRTIYYYAHLDKYAEGLKEGQQIRRGQRIGTVGSSGNASSDAPHLHFAILRTTPGARWWEPAAALNPYPLLAGESDR